ncbi:unnamed protein product [Ambrosiozyma monospora]|uniref:Unnamed protein product n=1 Tax=Ambrosiozyma monospora TaxID=43982 RepID=A0ACB5SZM6_AMBMO|nr:unnamed protein product [Ambrosiozyma monospora]
MFEQIIDQDPEFTKVVRYFRPTDYLTIAGFGLSGPAWLYLFEKYEPAQGRKFITPPKNLLGLTLTLGLTAGFLVSYNESTKRFWGVTENSREVEKDRYEVKRLLSEGKNPYGVEESALSPYLQDVASRHSTKSQLLMGFVPWFNFAKHPYHGVDLNKYYETRSGEEAWGLGDLVPLSKIPGLPK